MKTFTDIERREIEQRIQAACPGTKFEGPQPECFLSATMGSVHAGESSMNNLPILGCWFGPKGDQVAGSPVFFTIFGMN